MTDDEGAECGAVFLSEDIRGDEKPESTLIEPIADVDEDESRDNGVDPTEPRFIDHFSLGVPSSSVRFRNARVLLYGSNENQFILEDRRDSDANDDKDEKKRRNKSRRHTVTVRRMENATIGLRALRTVYTLAALLVLGFLFVFCFQVIIFLFLNLAVGGKVAKGGELALPLLGSILSVPAFLYGMASIMAIGGTFVKDMWGGNPLLRRMNVWDVVATEWLCFIVFLGIPCVALAITLLARKDNWWEMTALVWVSCAFAFQVWFAASILQWEIKSCFELVRLHRSHEGADGDDLWWKVWFRLVRPAVLLTQTHHYSGVREERYLVDGNEDPPELGYSSSSDHTATHTRMGLYSRLTRLPCCSSKIHMFDNLDPPARSHTVEEVRDNLSFLTAQNWSLEHMCCMRRGTRMIAVVDGGSSSLRPDQVASSTAFTILGGALILLLLIAALVWQSSPGVVTAFVVAIVAFCCLFPMVSSAVTTYRMYHVMKDKNAENIRGGMDDVGFKDAEEGSESDSSWNNEGNRQRGEGRNSPAKGAEQEDLKAQQEDTIEMEKHVNLFQVYETVRVTQPRPWLCWTMLTLELGFLFLWPLISLFINAGYGIALLFLVVGGISFLRHYFSTSVVLAELGSLRDIDVSSNHAEVNTVAGGINAIENGKQEGGERTMPHVGIISQRAETEEDHVIRKKANISDIVGKISRGHATQCWTWVLLVFALLIFLLVVLANSSESTKYNAKNVQLAEGFYYPPQPQLPYPTCELTKGFRVREGTSSALVDYAFLATTAYAGPEEATGLLNTWFGPGVVVDEYKLVSQYRKETETANHPVSYKLFSIPEIPGVGIVSIRGSESIWDWVHNIQLWSAAGMAQLVRAIIPFGWIWTPILDDLVKVVNLVESPNLKKVSYYRVVTDFVNAVLAGYGGNRFHGLRVTGVSLGGGLSIIVGAQTGASAVAISGPNAMISRATLDPPVTVDQLNTRVFNVIPDRDIIARIDDPAHLVQKVQCRAPSYSLFGCHSMYRSVCEIAFQCGSGDRPIMCSCVNEFGYPEPKQTGNQTFAEACPPKE